MPSILQKLFGRKDAGRDGAAPAAFVAAFGKHPAWNDFADDMGLETQRLIDAKRLVLAGVDTNIAQWDHLHEEQRLDAFRHLFVWQSEASVLVGRMWASSDGKGRTRYPMVACAEVAGMPLAAVMDRVPPVLERAEREIAAAATKEQVGAALDGARRTLREWAASPVAAADDVTPADAAKRLVACADLGDRARGLITLLYRLDQEAPHFLTWGRDGRLSASESRALSLRPAYVRLPACADSPPRSALLWSRFLSNLVSPRASTLTILPFGERWLDLVVGEPTPSSLYCLRANEKGVPLTTDIPYSIDAAFALKAGQFLASVVGASAPSPV